VTVRLLRCPPQNVRSGSFQSGEAFLHQGVRTAIFAPESS
jgi:hypothetical protein